MVPLISGRYLLLGFDMVLASCSTKSRTRVAFNADLVNLPGGLGGKWEILRPCFFPIPASCCLCIDLLIVFYLQPSSYSHPCQIFHYIWHCFVLFFCGREEEERKFNKIQYHSFDKIILAIYILQLLLIYISIFFRLVIIWGWI